MPEGSDEAMPDVRPDTIPDMTPVAMPEAMPSATSWSTREDKGARLGHESPERQETSFGLRFIFDGVRAH
jgi:hypothetical protein